MFSKESPLNINRTMSQVVSLLPGSLVWPIWRRFAFHCLWVFAVFVHLSLLTAAEYWVDRTNVVCSDTNGGTRVLPWKTVRQAATVAVAGDLVHVQGPAIYDERVILPRGGTPGNYITFKGENSPLLRGFDASSKSYIRIIGFEISHNPSGTNTYPAILLSGASHNQILDCNIHDVNSSGIRIGTSVGASPANYNVVRSNRVYNVGYVNGTNYDANAAVYCFGTNNLIEYNDLARCSDFISGKGYQNIIRNNYLHDVQTSYYGGISPHVDLWESQANTTNAVDGIHRILFERNFALSNMVNDGHGLLLQSTSMSTKDSGINTGDFVYRLNVLHWIGSYTALDAGFPGLRYYNNTVSHANAIHHQGAYSGTLQVNNGATNGVAVNNIFYRISVNQGWLYDIDSTTTNNFVNDNDFAYLSGSIKPPEAHGSTNDPLIVSELNNDFHLQATSPAIGAAGPQTRTIGSGNATNVVVVREARLFCDGWTMVDGDWISVGTNSATQITNIDYVNNMLFLARSISWSSGDEVQLDSTTDTGAYAYRASGYDYAVALIGLTNGSPVSGPTVLAASVVNPSVVRFAKFYVDGLEVGTANAHPYTTTVSLSTNRHSIEVRAYALYADPKLAASATVVVNAPPPAPPQALRIGP